jgi:hypothetical protein
MKNSELTATFLGYQSSGKTTFLAACLEAPATAGFKATAENIDKRKQIAGSTVFDADKFWSERCAEFRAGKPVKKSTTDDFFNFSVSLLMNGRDLTLNTIDYPGELADKLGKTSQSRSVEAQEIDSLTTICTQSDLLYLFVDAGLLEEGPETQRLLIDGEAAIARGIRIFSKAGGKKPMILVVTKADLLFRGCKPTEVTRQIQELNQNRSKGIKYLETEFPKAGLDPALFLKHRNVLRVFYVASLGAAPRPVLAHTAEGEVKGYGIPKDRTWQPLGLRETLSVGFEAVASWRRIQTTKLVMRKLSLPTLFLALLLTAVLLFDRHAYRQVEEALAAHQQGLLSAGEVLALARSADKPWHPTLNWPGRNTVFGAIPARDRTRYLRTVRYDFALKDYEARLAMVQEKCLALPTATDVQVDSYEDIDIKVRDLLFALNELEAELEPLREEVYDPDRKHHVETVLRPNCYDVFYRFGKDAISLLWASADHHQYKVNQVEPGIKEIRERLYAVHMSDVRPGNSPLYVEAVEAYDHGKCVLAAGEFLRQFDLQNMDDEIAKVIVGLNADCQSEEVTVLLQKIADDWDKIEAEAIYQAYPPSGQTVKVTASLHELMTVYVQNCETRKKVGYQSRYSNEAARFLSWHQSLERSYAVSAVDIRISSENPILSSQQVPYTCGSGWSKETCYRTVYDPPDGVFTLLVDNQAYGTVAVNQFSGTYIFPFRFPWKPGAALTLKLYNKLSDRTIEVEISELYGLLKLTKEPVTYRGITFSLGDMDIPPLQPTTLEYPR